jgi:hypothetical protein
VRAGRSKKTAEGGGENQLDSTGNRARYATTGRPAKNSTAASENRAKSTVIADKSVGKSVSQFLYKSEHV